MLKVKYEIFSNSVFICCSVLSSILTVLLFSEMNLYFGLRSFKLRKYAKCKIKSCFYIHLTHFKLSCWVPYILLPTSSIAATAALSDGRSHPSQLIENLTQSQRKHDVVYIVSCYFEVYCVKISVKIKSKHYHVFI